MRVIEVFSLQQTVQSVALPYFVCVQFRAEKKVYLCQNLTRKMNKKGKKLKRYVVLMETKIAVSKNLDKGRCIKSDPDVFDLDVSEINVYV